MVKLIYGQRVDRLPGVYLAGKFNEQEFLEVHCNLVCALLQR